MALSPANDAARCTLEGGEPFRGGLASLTPLLYDELRRVGARLLGSEARHHTFTATALVHEAFLRLARERRCRWESRNQFLAAATRAIRRILIDHARARAAQKRGGEARRLPLDERTLPGGGAGTDLVALEDALRRLERIDARGAQLVELRFFGGLTFEEAAGVQGVSCATAKRDWEFARAWLYRALRET